MRLSIGFLLTLAVSLAQSPIDPDVVNYLALSSGQSAALAQAAVDFNIYTQAKQTRLNQLSGAIQAARALRSPDLADIGRLYIEYELILRDAVSQAIKWRSNSSALLAADQSEKLKTLRRANGLSDVISYAQSVDLIGNPYFGGSSSTSSAFGRFFNFYLPDRIYPALQNHLSLANEQVNAIVQVLQQYNGGSSRLFLQMDQANSAAQLELVKSAMDPLLVGRIISNMDSDLITLPGGLAQLRTQLLPLLTVSQRMALSDLDDLSQLMPLLNGAVCMGLLTPNRPSLTVVTEGAVAFDVNRPPLLDFGCSVDSSTAIALRGNK